MASKNKNTLAIPSPQTKPAWNVCSNSTKRWRRKNNCPISWKIQKDFVSLQKMNEGYVKEGVY